MSKETRKVSQRPTAIKAPNQRNSIPSENGTKTLRMTSSLHCPVFLSEEALRGWLLWACSATENDLCCMTSADGGSGLVWREHDAGSHPLRDFLFVSFNRGSGEVADGKIWEHNFTLLRCISRRKITVTQVEPQLPEAVAWPTHRSLPSRLSPVWPHLPPTPSDSDALGEGQELCWAFLCEAPILL